MLLLRRFLPVLLIVALSAFAWSGYRSDTVGDRLFYEYFEPQSDLSYRGIRAFGAAPLSEQDASLLRQLARYHQEEQYAEALAAARAFLESNPASPDHRPYLLGGTAAVQIGEFAVAEYLLAGMPVADEAVRRERDWYRALLHTRAQDYRAAIALLEAEPSGRSTPLLTELRRQSVN